MNVKAGYHQKTNLTSYQCPIVYTREIINFLSNKKFHVWFPERYLSLILPKFVTSDKIKWNKKLNVRLYLSEFLKKTEHTHL